ncbi:MAG: alpha-galactosidase [Propionibacteriaceae bacterium]|jgi:alpha-galactosidase|nr:alpha-galactosidase [Propionibacteriaceae bacterium]
MSEPAALELVHLRRGGVSLIVSLGRDGRSLPQILCWDLDLGPLEQSELRDLRDVLGTPVTDGLNDVVQDLSLLPAFERGWLGRPGVSGSRQGDDWSPAFRTTACQVDQTSDSASLQAWASDPAAGLSVRIDLELTPSGLLRARAQLTNDGPTRPGSATDRPWRVDAVRLAWPVPAQATELMDLTGRWAKERIPQRLPFSVGCHSRESRLGRPGLGAPLLLIAGQERFSYRQGRVWAVHLGHSGNQELYAEATPNGGRVLGGGELLGPDEIVLAPGQSYTSPWLYGSVGQGLDQMSGRFHQFIRRQAGPRRPRPVVLNTWEAVYFQHDQAKLMALAERAAALGVERFVLDDGWFGARRDDRHGLGDWTVSEQAWPQGLGPLIRHVRSLGLDFGLWVEPEMVNLDSDLARRHPDWLMRTSGRLSYPTRHQYGLDLTWPEAYQHVLGRLDALLHQHDIAFLKWDHNRPLVEAGHSSDGRPVTHRQVAAWHEMLAELKRRHPGLEIESCASGGGRVDLGVLPLVDRFWGSDCNDPLERALIDLHTSLLLPPEFIGAHVGPTPSHTTGRVHSLDFRAATMVWGHFGVELDLTRTDPAEAARLAWWIDFHKTHRDLLHSGTVVNCDQPEPAWLVHGVVSPDQTRALFSVSLLARPLTWPPPPLSLAGLDPEARYRVSLIAPDGVLPEREPTPDWARRRPVLPGAVLMGPGLQRPAPYPESAYFIALDPA